MRLYRLTRRAYADMSGAGGLVVSGRWHKCLAPVLYASGSRALAMLEALVHLDVAFDELPRDYVFQVIDTLDAAAEIVPRSALEPGGRAHDMANFGSDWLAARRSSILQVPSVLIPQESNFLINPAHAETTMIRSEVETCLNWDERLFRNN